MNDVAAIVITYNRCEKLKKCIAGILDQDYPVDIVIIDNHSEDDTQIYLSEVVKEHSGITVHRTEENIGGAGGFSLGMKLAFQKGYSYFWLMDDDSYPEVNALSALMRASDELTGKYGFLYSRVVWSDGSFCKINLPKFLNGKQKENSYELLSQASFVSFFVPRSVVKLVGIPISEFFIWGDDVEYSRRIAVRNNLPGYWVQDSVVCHDVAKNCGSDISLDAQDRINRYYYAFRNERYLYRQEGISGILYFFMKCIWNYCKIIIRARDNKADRIRVMNRAIRDGSSFAPVIEMCSTQEE